MNGQLAELYNRLVAGIVGQPEVLIDMDGLHENYKIIRQLMQEAPAELAAKMEKTGHPITLGAFVIVKAVLLGHLRLQLMRAENCPYLEWARVEAVAISEDTAVQMLTRAGYTAEDIQRRWIEEVTDIVAIEL